MEKSPLQGAPRNESPHRHGGDPRDDFERLKIPPRPLADFSVNVNPMGPPREVLEAWGVLAGEIARYPDVNGRGVVRFYEERFGLPEDGVLPGNGSVELLYLVPRALGFRQVGVISPCFHDYIRAARLAGAAVSLLPLSADDGFAPLSAKALDGRVAGLDAVFVGNPNNPTGTVFPPETLLALAERHPKRFFLVDEAFVQFAEEDRPLTLLRRGHLRPNLLVFHSLTKFYSLAGLRLGAVAGHPKTISRLRAHKEPWTVNAVAEKVAGYLSRCGEFERKTRQYMSRERRRIYARLRKIPGIRPFAPAANFFLVQWTATENLDDLLRRLFSRGFHVRDCRNFPGLEDNFFRFAIRLPAENDRLLDAVAGVEEGEPV